MTFDNLSLYVAARSGIVIRDVVLEIDVAVRIDRVTHNLALWRMYNDDGKASRNVESYIFGHRKLAE